MTIGFVLSETPGVSETFINSKIKSLIKNGHKIIIFSTKKKEFNLCEVIEPPSLERYKVSILFDFIFILINMISRHNRVLNIFLNLEKKDDSSFIQSFKNLYINNHILRKKIDWLHFPFSAITQNRENVAKSIGAQMSISLRGYDIMVYPLKDKDCYKKLWPKVKKVHSVSYALLDIAKNYGLTQDTLQNVIYPAIDTEFFNFNKNKRLDRKNKISILTVSRLKWIKGLDYTIQAMQLLKQFGLNFEYLIIGEGEEYDKLSYFINLFNLKSHIKLIGVKKSEHLLEYYKNADIYLQYSINEGFCNSVLEAQSMRLLTISSNGGGLLENIVNNQTGWIVPKRNPRALSEKIIEVINKEEIVLHRIRENARKNVKTKFNIKKQSEEFSVFFN